MTFRYKDIEFSATFVLGCGVRKFAPAAVSLHHDPNVLD